MAQHAREGTCRLCFEPGGEDLIAPCRCSGTSKWIHRRCLNKWRATGRNTRAMTHCPSCAFQYRLKLHRVMDSEASVRARRFVQLLAAQTFGCFVLVQGAIIASGIIVRACDPSEAAVKFFRFHQEDGLEHSDTFAHAFRHHKCTYYVAGMLLLLALLGVLATISGLVMLCRGGSPRSLASRASAGSEGPSSSSESDDQSRTLVPPAQQTYSGHCASQTCDFCCQCCRDCCMPHYSWYGGWYSPGGDCLYLCSECAGSCCRCGDMSSDGCPTINADQGGECAVLLLVVVFILVVIGIFAAVVVGVMAVQKAVQKYAQLQQMRVLADEYVVEDLADPVDLGGALGETGGKPHMQAMGGAEVPSNETLSLEKKLEQSNLQFQIAEDILHVYGTRHNEDGTGDSAPPDV